MPLSNDEVDRREVAPTTNEADLSQSSTPPWLTEDATLRSLEPIVRRRRYSEACEVLAYDLTGAPQLEQYAARVSERGYAIAAHLSHTRTRPIFKATISVNVIPAVTRSRVVPGNCQTVQRPSGPAANAISRYRVSLVFALRTKASPIVAQTLNRTHWS
jgi:hypothetical protein